ncbi:metallophosphoesterase [Rubripirellula amarantea]|uniref:Calcineurin-like phosphoesterase superfamily domain protein n=1 Tax=Rubripirellula amarantea TaxID=2527999 RepID=A0A5C5WTL4_9BACT|nr:metallophosphoesterase [Rubripirellula amarantea]MDA8743131.1 metallophosphoesterase [Rubripirellula amarantea]TWT53519.1 Calcineurin-like phosphoesterase superfamily domain protein [Rubripirellula amarantea]
MTDLHVDHCPREVWSRLCEKIAANNSDGVLLTGDLSQSVLADGDANLSTAAGLSSRSTDVALASALMELAKQTKGPTHFVLGNHDFYGSSIAQTRRSVADICRSEPRLRYLTDVYDYRLAEGVYLLGEDGWGDATLGDYEGSYVRLNDFVQIEDFTSIPSDAWKAKLNQLGRDSADRLSDKIKRLPPDTKHVLILTHVPPLPESCWYEGHTTDENWSPFFVCGEVGKCLLAASQSLPEIQFTVLCGHTHHDGVAQVRDNLIIYTGASVYGHPEIEAIVTVNESGIDVLRVG